jgi:hypothetical protein
MRTALSVRPTGCFQVAWPRDLTEGCVIPMRRFSEDLVAHRDARRVVRIIDTTDVFASHWLDRGTTAAPSSAARVS